MCKDNYAATVQKIMPIEVRPEQLFDCGNLYWSRYARSTRHIRTINPRLNQFPLTLFFEWSIIIFTDGSAAKCLMAKKPKPDRKELALRQEGTLNPHPEQVTDELFLTNQFFDARDLVQVKYEMVRRVQSEGQPISRAAAAFGFSRPSFYQAQATFQQGGLPALMPHKRGPKQAHKLTSEVLAFVRQLRQENPAWRPADLSARIQERYGITVHPRSIERALVRSQKKPR